MDDLNRNELEAMRILWERGPLKPGEIESEFSWSIENATLRSTLAVLMRKRHVTRKKQGKAFVYRARTNRRGALSKMVQRMAEVFTGGSTADLMAQLVQLEKLSREDVRELQEIARQTGDSTDSDQKRGVRS